MEQFKRFMKICFLTENYAIVHASKKCMSYIDLQKSSIGHFVLEGDEMQHYVIDVKSILGPLMAIPDKDGKQR